MWMRIVAVILVLSTSTRCIADVFDIYIAAGQSNMDGRGLNSDLIGPLAPLAAPQPNVLLHYTNPRDPVQDAAERPTYQSAGWVTLRPGYAIQPGFPNGGALPGTRFGPEISFAKAADQYTDGRRVAILKVSRGGTSLAGDWDPSEAVNGPKGFLFEAFETVVPQAIQLLQSQGHSVEVRGMIWHQGEGDGSSSQTTYETNLTEFIQTVRQTVGYPNLPFMIGELESVDGGRENVRNAQAAVAAAMSFVEFVPSTGLPVNSDGTHFTSASVVEFGNRFAGAMQSSISNLPGDFNRDGLVDNLDYQVWASFENSTTDARADANNDGIVNQADYAIWQQHAVPEPPAGAIAIAMALCGAALMALRRRQQRLRMQPCPTVASLVRNDG